MKRIAVICARGGSKGVAGKNRRDIAGKPLLAYTIEQAFDAGVFDLVAVSSDAPDILAIAEENGVKTTVRRPAELASDIAGKVPAIIHCVLESEQRSGLLFDTIVDLDATAPLRTAEQIRDAMGLFENSDADNMLSGSQSRKSPYFNIVERDVNGRIQLSKRLENPVLSRQTAPACFDLNGAIYIWRRDALMNNPVTAMGGNTILYEMPELTGIDIDTETDFAFVEFLLLSRQQDTSN